MTVGPQTPGTGSMFSGGMSAAQQNANNLLNQGGAFYGGSNAALPTDGQVWMGSEYTTSDEDFFADNPDLQGDPMDLPSFNRRENFPQQYGSDGKYAVSEGQEMYWSLDDTQRQQFYDAYKAGVRPDSDGNINLPDESSMKRAWDSAVVGASAMTKQTGKLTSPFDFQLMMGRREQQKGNTTRGSGSGAYMGPTTTIQNTSEGITSSASQSRNFLENAMTNYLGRRPKEGEYEQFLKSLNYQQEENPATRRTVTKSSGRSLGDAKTKIRSNTTGDSGLDDSQIAKEYAKSRPDYAETTLNTRGKSLIMEAFGG